MRGFFNTAKIQDKVNNCVSCGLYKKCKSPKIQPYGNFGKQIMIIGSKLTEFDDRKGIPMQGRTGRYLQSVLENYHIDLFEDCVSLNALNCFTEEKITTKQLLYCRSIVFAAIEKYKPKVIILLGKNALFSVVGNFWKKDLGEIEKWRGYTIPDRTLNTWVCTTYDYTRMIDSDTEKNIDQTIFKDDLRTFVDLIHKPLPKYKEPKIEFITDLSVINDIEYYKSKVMVTPYAAFDYEATGKKPHAKGHKIICCAIANTENHAWVFMLPQSRRRLQPLLDFLTNPEICKIAQNFKYENTWSKVILGVDVANWKWDTMLAAHYIDNRQGITGLKFQTYVEFGISDYASEITPYLESGGDNANEKNKIEDLVNLPGGKEKLMKYCGLDAVYEYRLAMLQMPLILPSKPKIY